jgi:hypothetical protein
MEGRSWCAPMLMGQCRYIRPMDDNLPQLLYCAQSDTESRSQGRRNQALARVRLPGLSNTPGRVSASSLCSRIGRRCELWPGLTATVAHKSRHRSCFIFARRMALVARYKADISPFIAVISSITACSSSASSGVTLCLLRRAEIASRVPSLASRICSTMRRRGSTSTVAPTVLSDSAKRIASAPARARSAHWPLMARKERKRSCSLFIIPT